MMCELRRIRSGRAPHAGARAAHARRGAAAKGGAGARDGAAEGVPPASWRPENQPPHGVGCRSSCAGCAKPEGRRRGQRVVPQHDRGATYSSLCAHPAMRIRATSDVLCYRVA